MARLKLKQSKKLTSFGLWKRNRDGTRYRCGNVEVRKVKRPKENHGPGDYWRIFVRHPSGRWEELTLKQRPWGYGHPGQAKIGAALVAAHQRGAYQ